MCVSVCVALQAGIASADNPGQLLIALEPEAASIYVRKLRLYQLVPEPPYVSQPRREPTPDLSLSLDRLSDDEFPPGTCQFVTCDRPIISN